MNSDPSNGYDAIADEFIKIRSNSGQDIIRAWAATLPQAGSVIDLGAGSGEPITAALTEAGLTVSAIDASPRMVAAFQNRFPQVEIACEPVEQSCFFGKTYDAVVAIGLIFLLSPEEQNRLIQRVSKILKPDGKFLFSGPYQAGTWTDVLTGLASTSLGLQAYTQALTEADLQLINRHEDAGGSHYYEAQKIIRSA